MKIFYDKQGNYQLYKEWQDEVVRDEPEEFKFAEVEKLPENSINTRFIDGKFVERQEPELTEEEKQVIETAETKREYEEERAKLVNALNAAFIDGDEELMKEIREELQELKESVAKEVSENVQA
ncbi:hypothetical protein [Veillonella montpellierensis]|uniref:hypothetical protein n=1 Tax=Veillonella montpellierensis TaxID=187328 RepID=UPI0023F91BE8|nr:hypothetical protein [Veillonella montpellierensis]